MTIDEAIEHAKEVACTCDDSQCAAEHIQLSEWLRQARGADKAARWYTEKIRKLEAENAMLRERLLESREANEHLFTEPRRYKSIFRMKPRAMNALFDENSKLREEIEAAKHDLQVFSMRSVQLDAENAKLRTQLADVTESMGRVEERCAKLREELEDQEGYDQMLRDRLRQQTELRVKAEAENAKLRKLAAEAIRLMQADNHDCGLCKHYDECWTNDAMDYSPSGCVICNEARELGIEVDE